MAKPVVYDKQSLVRLTSSELEQVQKKAEQAGLSVSRYFVNSALSGGNNSLSGLREQDWQEILMELRKTNIHLSFLNTNRLSGLNNGSQTDWRSELNFVNETLNKILNVIKDKE